MLVRSRWCATIQAPQHFPEQYHSRARSRRQNAYVIKRFQSVVAPPVVETAIGSPEVHGKDIFLGAPNLGQTVIVPGDPIAGLRGIRRFHIVSEIQEVRANCCPGVGVPSQGLVDLSKIMISRNVAIYLAC